MATILSKKCPFNIVELGAGDGTKTKVVLKYLSSLKVPFTYVPVDISAHVLEILEEHMKNDIPDLKIKKVAKTYNDALASPDWD
ncbi:Histidine-specific domain protein [Candidatus Megaera venefica]|uniref:Histidine-specific domain protein n=1 Tax=Candidatus Megaera venefica TaxID=2055910 RepID=A0ABU5NEL8_9RICK|nr:Histidine-specific domain protein [Candidatus Megaera venefica]